MSEAESAASDACPACLGAMSVEAMGQPLQTAHRLHTSAASLALLPAESMALTVALAQVQRGEEPMPNVATVCVLALARLVDRYDYREAGEQRG